MSVEGVLQAVRHFSGWYDDDWSDWMQHTVTSNLLVAAATVVWYKIFVVKPIECMPPSFFPDSWITVGMTELALKKSDLESYHIPQQSESFRRSSAAGVAGEDGKSSAAG